MFASPQYDVGTGAMSMNLPLQLAAPEARSDESSIVLQNAQCYGVNTRRASMLVDGYKPGQTWIRISIRKTGANVGKFSIPLEVFQVVLTNARKAASFDSSERIDFYTNQIKPMMDALRDSRAPADQVAKLLTPGWKVEAGVGNVKVTGFNESDLFGGYLDFTFEKVYTKTFPPYSAYTERNSKGVDVTYPFGFVVEDKGVPISFQQNAAWTTKSADGTEVTREPRSPSDVVYTQSHKVLQLEPRIFGGKDSGCGGYTSPLMVFLDEKRPEFRGQTEKMFSSQITSWVEPDAPGYFLAIDKFEDHSIRSADQLFGNTPEQSNGFEALKAFDSNHDGVIDAKDKDFKKLVLWRDTNGDSISQKDEVISLKAGRIIRIDLKYERGHVKNFGPRAEAHETADVVYRDRATGILKHGRVVDIWFQKISARGNQVTEAEPLDGMSGE
jgi:hypothetical protein